ncbi:hypothetical protein ABIB00_003385 [Bradyrhizobium sp. LB14.3]
MMRNGRQLSQYDCLFMLNPLVGARRRRARQTALFRQTIGAGHHEVPNRKEVSGLNCLGLLRSLMLIEVACCLARLRPARIPETSVHRLVGSQRDPGKPTRLREEDMALAQPRS